MSASSPVAVLNVFTPKEGWLEAFIEVQRSVCRIWRKQIAGFRGSRLYRAVDGRTAALISVFESSDAFNTFVASPSFAAHRATLATMLDTATPGVYELVYESGTVECPVVE